MKKTLLLVIFLSALYSARASDTLTIRQVFNFNVGDTFDYRKYIESVDYGFHTTTYKRKVLLQKTYSTNNDTIFTLYSISPGNITQLDTITNLDSFAVLKVPNQDTFCQYFYSFDTSTYSGYTSNTSNESCFENAIYYRFTDGLGITLKDLRWIGQSGVGTNYDIEELIYYSNGVKIIGSPYAVIGIRETIASNSLISIYPTPASDVLHLLFSGMSRHSTRLILSNLIGQEVYSSPITDTETTHDISKLPSGIYTWRIMSDDAILKTGKVVKK
ncbi:MAG: hypothetical protein JWO03_1972 [Bacteroidetes bacterium]|nr:hypothetical protein [Bacteroidota bacterium]